MTDSWNAISSPANHPGFVNSQLGFEGVMQVTEQQNKTQEPNMRQNYFSLDIPSTHRVLLESCAPIRSFMFVEEDEEYPPHTNNSSRQSEIPGREQVSNTNMVAIKVQQGNVSEFILPKRVTSQRSAVPMQSFMVEVEEEDENPRATGNQINTLSQQSKISRREQVSNISFADQHLQARNSATSEIGNKSGNATTKYNNNIVTDLLTSDECILPTGSVNKMKPNKRKKIVFKMHKPANFVHGSDKKQAQC